MWQQLKCRPSSGDSNKNRPGIDYAVRESAWDAAKEAAGMRALKEETILSDTKNN
jgi:hypothetical protein